MTIFYLSSENNNSIVQIYTWLIQVNQVPQKCNILKTQSREIDAEAHQWPVKREADKGRLVDMSTNGLPWKRWQRKIGGRSHQ
jgi:hypothetical protein